MTKNESPASKIWFGGKVSQLVGNCLTKSGLHVERNSFESFFIVSQFELWQVRIWKFRQQIESAKVFEKDGSSPA